MPTNSLMSSRYLLTFLPVAFVPPPFLGQIRRTGLSPFCHRWVSKLISVVQQGPLSTPTSCLAIQSLVLSFKISWPLQKFCNAAIVFTRCRNFIFLRKEHAKLSYSFFFTPYQTMLPSVYHPCFPFGKPQVQISVQIKAILTRFSRLSSVSPSEY